MDTLFEPLSLTYRLDKNSLRNHEGLSLKEFRSALKPRWRVVWIELLLGYIFLLTPLVGLTIFEKHASNFSLIVMTLISAFIIGLAQAYIQLFFHEAAHANLACNRKLNDKLANFFIGIFIGQDIKDYRAVHFKHHLQLGTIEDTERTYFEPLNMRFIVESLTGIKVLRVLLRRKAFKTMDVPIKKNKQLILGLLFHAILLGTAAVWMLWGVFFAWLIAMAIVLPFFIAVRQVLEHRDVNAKSHINYHHVPQGQTHRLFGDSLLARIIGGAGFNRHLLHHWEPQISYTQLHRLENFLLQTKVADFINRNRTTYTATFLELLRAP